MKTTIIYRNIWREVITELGSRIKEVYGSSPLSCIEEQNKLEIKDVGSVEVVGSKLRVKIIRKGGTTTKEYNKFWEGDIIWLLGLALAWYVQTGEVIFSAEKKDNVIHIQ